jgi:hypothetical protein
MVPRTAAGGIWEAFPNWNYMNPTADLNYLPENLNANDLLAEETLGAPSEIVAHGDEDEDEGKEMGRSPAIKTLKTRMITAIGEWTMTGASEDGLAPFGSGNSATGGGYCKPGGHYSLAEVGKGHPVCKNCRIMKVSGVVLDSWSIVWTALCQHQPMVWRRLTA